MPERYRGADIPDAIFRKTSRKSFPVTLVYRVAKTVNQFAYREAIFKFTGFAHWFPPKMARLMPVYALSDRGEGAAIEEVIDAACECAALG